MNNLLYFRKRMNQKEAHDYVSERHRHWLDNVKIKVDTNNGVEADRYVPNRVDNFDHKSWLKSVAIFWACIFAFGLLMAGLRYATACGDLEPDGTIKQIRVDGV